MTYYKTLARAKRFGGVEIPLLCDNPAQCERYIKGRIALGDDYTGEFTIVTEYYHDENGKLQSRPT